MSVVVLPHDPAWIDAYAAETSLLKLAIGDNVCAVHHVGSTAIPTVVAKPVIDILVVVRDLELTDANAPAMRQLGYQIMGDFGIPGRRYFRKDNSAGIRTHHVHVYAVGNSEIQRHLNFRDYLIAHPQRAAEYSRLKLQLIEENQRIGKNYQEGKADFIRHVETLANQWRKI
jgi:GrpB-like predicted nucleotidyltransferase (UPF0157 family)